MLQHSIVVAVTGFLCLSGKEKLDGRSLEKSPVFFFLAISWYFFLIGGYVYWANWAGLLGWMDEIPGGNRRLRPFSFIIFFVSLWDE